MPALRRGEAGEEVFHLRLKCCRRRGKHCGSKIRRQRQQLRLRAGKTAQALSVVSAMRSAAFIFLLLLMVGCAAPRQVYQPSLAPFDYDPEARIAYIQAYGKYYRSGLAGDKSEPGCTFGQGGLAATACERGGWDGLLAARKALLQREIQMVEKNAVR